MQNPSQRYPIVSVILAGGQGRRLWPLSTPERPKPLLCPAGEPSLLRQTLRRCPKGMPPLLVCGAAHAQPMRQEAMQEGPVRMLIEPEGRNTAAAICAAALSMPPESLMLVLPSDHWIDSQAGFDATLAAMTPWAQQGYLMTIGITPDHPSPDYGYIEMGDALDTQSWRVQRFLEKPDTTLAETLIAQGNLWNSGIFLWRADRVLAEARHHCPEIVQTCEVAMQQAQEQDGMLYLEAIAWHACHAAPIDRAVLERTDRAAMTKAQFEWSDLGSFEALARRGIELA